jgi:hypothetical protein
MRLRGMMLDTISLQHSRARIAFKNLPEIFYLCLTAVQNFSTHHRPPVVCTGKGRQKFSSDTSGGRYN